MKEEVVIINGDLDSVYENGKDLTKGFTKYVSQKWKNPQNILGEPQYAAIHVNGTDSIRVIIEIDRQSKLEQGEIIPVGSPIPVDIPITFGKNKLQGIKYTNFRKLVTHRTTDDL